MSKDVTITPQGVYTLFTGNTPKGTEWLLRNLIEDRVLLSYREVVIRKHAMEREGLSVEVL